MQIDWITVAAQVVNFLVLVWLLQKFLYGPITNAMNRREETIKSRFDDAKAERENAEQKARELDEQKKSLDDRREELLEEARAEADKLRKKLEHEGREEADRRRRDWIKQIEGDRAAFLEQMREGSAAAFRELASDALNDLARTPLDSAIADRFLERLDALDVDGRTHMRDAARSQGQVTVVSGAELDADIRRRLTRSIHDMVGRELDVQYRIRPDLGAGIRLKSGGRTIEWSIDDYLDRYIDRLQQSLWNDRRVSDDRDAGKGGRNAKEKNSEKAHNG